MHDKIYEKKKMDAENTKMQNEAQSVFSISGHLIWLLPARSNAQVVRYRAKRGGGWGWVEGHTRIPFETKRHNST